MSPIDLATDASLNSSSHSHQLPEDNVKNGWQTQSNPSTPPKMSLPQGELHNSWKGLLFKHRPEKIVSNVEFQDKQESPYFSPF